MKPEMKTSGKGLRVRKRELFRSLGYEPHPGQVEVHRSRASRRVLACGARWGKSTCAAMEAVAALLEPAEDSIGWIVAPSYDLTERIFLRVVNIATERLSHRVEELKSRDRRIVMRNLGGGRSELRCKSADNPVSLLGEGLDWLIVDEAARLREDTWDSYLSQRLVDKGGWALFLSTPRGCNWFHGLFKQGCSDDADFESWASPSWQNPHLDGDMIEAERGRMLDDVFAQEYEARFLGAELDPCEMCGGPSKEVPRIHLHGGPGEPERCPTCAELVDGEGRTIVHLSAQGMPSVKVILLLPAAENLEDSFPAPPI